MRKRPLSALLAVLFLMSLLPASALAGVEPTPWHIVIENRTDRLDPASPLYDQVWENFVVTFTDASGVNYEFTRRDFLAPGGTLHWLVYLTGINRSVQSWSVAITKGGVEPSPWRVYAFEPGAAPADEPRSAPSLTLPDGPPVAKEYPLFGFASPGVLVGSACLASSPCPVGDDWKNHGEYVRCVAHAAEDFVAQGALTQEEADVMVSAAARSNVGKK